MPPQAGDRALAQFANDEAATYYQQALELLAVATGPSEMIERRHQTGHDRLYQGQ